MANISGGLKQYTSGPASSNWLALQKQLKKSKRNPEPRESHARKKRKIERTRSLSSSPAPSGASQISHTASIQRALISQQNSTHVQELEDAKNGESLSALRKMIFGQVEYTESQQLPGRYLSLDCEMVGVGIDGAESSLARVSLVNFYGAIQLDEFVRQRERVVDYRTQFSGIRESDMIKAKPFDVVQKQVGELLKDRILIGHAVYNDLKALLLSHPRPQTRDTQFYAGKFKVVRSKYVALRHLVKQELNVTIQTGEHSSVTDARATMAVYRLHRREWEKGNKQPGESKKRKKREKSSEVKQSEAHLGDNDEGEEITDTFPGGGRKGVSSGLSTIVRRGVNSRNHEVKSGGASGKTTKWWKELASAPNDTLRIRKPG